MKSVLILYPHQLYEADKLPEVDSVILVEDPLSFGVDRDRPLRIHKQKIILFRSAMRRYAEEVLWPVGYKVDYIELDVLLLPIDILKRASKFEKIYMFDPLNSHITEGLLTARRQMGDRAPAIEFIPNPNFLLKEYEIREFFAQTHKQTFDEFYQWQRERFNILIGDDYKPVGGNWLLKPTTKVKVIESMGRQVFGNDDRVADSIKFVSEHFPDNPGTLDFVWPTSHSEAKQWLDDYIESHLDSHDPSLVRLGEPNPWTSSSALSALLNIGLLSPTDIIERALRFYDGKEARLYQTEIFIRQILGWREYCRATHVANTDSQLANLKAQRRLTADWYHGSTGILPFDNIVNKALGAGQLSNHERLYVVGTLMMISGICREDITKWFSEMLVDAYDWALSPNIDMLSQFSAGPLLGPGVYLATSKYILDHSDYQKAEWCDIWDGLYWNFIEVNQTELKRYPQTRAIVHRLARLNKDKRRIINYRAQDFLAKFTI